MNILPAAIAASAALSFIARASSQSPSSDLTAKGLQQIEVGTPRRTVEKVVGMPLRQATLKQSKDFCSFDLVYCRYTRWQKTKPKEFGPLKEYEKDVSKVNDGNGYAVADLRVFYDKDSENVVFFIVEVVPSVVNYAFPGGTLGITKFDSIKNPRAVEGTGMFIEGYKTSLWWAELHYLKNDRYYWLVGLAEYNKSGVEAEVYETRDRSLVDRERTTVDRLLVYGPKAEHCDEDWLKRAVATPGWVWDRDWDY